MPMPSETPWERESFKSASRFHAFCHLRDLPESDRSTLRALNEHRARCLQKPAARAVNGRWKLWSVEDDWAGRLSGWDAEVDRQRRAKMLRAQLDAVERHQRLVAAALNVAFVPLRSVLNRLSDPAFVSSLETAPAWPVVRDAMRSVAVLPHLINAERQALGLSQVDVTVDDRRIDRAFADTIVSSPELTRLASDFLAQVSQASGAKLETEPEPA